MLITLIAAAMAFGGQDVPAQAAPAAQDTVIVQGQQKARNKRVCRRSVSTGSIMTKSICKTAGEWEIERDRQIAQAERLRMSSMMDNEARRISTDEPPVGPR
ncbi:MAG: hypothetical protein EOP60_08060 [Sphingomonadales bacterium]|nr:MAG: hypothetical protein EOP60_08060 [Sphingomonadales bacterium]